MSVDSVFVHKRWDAHELSKMVKGGIPFAMLSDGGGKWVRPGGLPGGGGGGGPGRVSHRPDGVIQGFEVLSPRWGAMSARASGRSRLPEGAGEQGQRGDPLGLAAG
jgi:peroxiredoxin (alkyl hydroperoxide reductase subunit C)